MRRTETESSPLHIGHDDRMALGAPESPAGSAGGIPGALSESPAGIAPVTTNALAFADEDCLGQLAISKAGHDKGRVYAIVGGEGCFVRLADGKSRTLASPKKKNKKHIQLVRRRLDPEGLTDQQIRLEIQAFTKREAEVQKGGQQVCPKPM